MKPKAPIGFVIAAFIYHACLWVYPIADGGLSNLSYFVAWGFSLFAAVGGFFVLVAEHDKPLKYRDHPLFLRVIGLFTGLGGIAWVAWHGHFTLASVATFGALMGLMLKMKEKAAEENGDDLR
mgnify:CR=1 FL=1